MAALVAISPDRVTIEMPTWSKPGTDVPATWAILANVWSRS